MTLKSYILNLPAMLRKALQAGLESKLKQGFTLIELLVVIAIIGILSGIIITNIQGVRERARDARRKSDLNSLKTSLRIFYNDNQQFPADSNGRIVGCSTPAVACTWGQTFASGTTTYMNTLPLDPSSSATSTVTYTYNQVTSDTYTLIAVLENESDSDILDTQTRCGTGTGTQYVLCE